MAARRIPLACCLDRELFRQHAPTMERDPERQNHGFRRLRSDASTWLDRSSTRLAFSILEPGPARLWLAFLSENYRASRLSPDGPGKNEWLDARWSSERRHE